MDFWWEENWYLGSYSLLRLDDAARHQVGVDILILEVVHTLG